MEDNQLVFNIKLNMDQVNVVLNTLGKLPYEAVSALMHNIQGQANQQIQEYRAAQPQDQDSNIVQ